MITEQKLNIIVNSKIGWLTKYYMCKINFTESQAYCYIRDCGIIDILKNKDTRLYLESVDLIRDAIDIYYSQGQQSMIGYLKANIG